MNKRFLLAGAALLGALFAGSTSQAPTAAVEASTKAEPTLPAGNYQVTSRKPAPTKPTSQPVAQRRVAAQAPPMFQPGFQRVFIEKPHLRKVKYGRHRWVMV